MGSVGGSIEQDRMSVPERVARMEPRAGERALSDWTKVERAEYRVLAVARFSSDAMRRGYRYCRNSLKRGSQFQC